MKKHKLSIMCPGALFIKTAPSQPEDEKYCVNISRPERSRMNYVICRSHQMQKYMFDITCPGVLFLKTAPGPPEHEKSCTDVSRPKRIRMHYVTH
jgi:hypothetical protein